MTDKVDDQEVDLKEVLVQVKQLQEKVVNLENENKTLKQHADDVIKEKRDLKAKADQALLDKERELEQKTSRTKEENELLIKQYKEQNDKLQNDIKAFQEKEYNNKIDAKALELAQKLAAKNPEKAKLLAKEFKARIKLEEDGSVKVLDELGNLTISPVDSLVTEYSTKYAFLCDGIDSTGGGVHSSNSAPVVKRYSEMSESEKRTLLHTDRNKFYELKKAEQDPPAS